MKATNKLILNEYLLQEWNSAYNYFSFLSPRQREVKKAQFYILTLFYLGYNPPFIHDYILNSALMVSMEDIRQSIEFLC